MKFTISNIVILLVMILAAGCGNLTEPSGFTFDTQSGVPLNTSILSNVVTIKGNQFAAPITFANSSSAAYSQYSINGAAFTAGQEGDKLYAGDTLQIQQTSSSIKGGRRITTVTVGGYTTTFTTVTSSSGGVSTATDTAGDSVTISNVSASLSAANNIVHYTITADTVFSPGSSTSVSSGSTIPVAFTLQAISNTGEVVFTANASQIAINYGSYTGTALTTGTLPTTVSGNLPTAVLGYKISTTNYWAGLISYWQIVPETLVIQ